MDNRLLVWDGLGEEPMTNAEWRAYLRSRTRDALEGMRLFGGAREKEDVEYELDQRGKQ